MKTEKMIKGQKTNVLILMVFYVISMALLLATGLSLTFEGKVLIIVQLALVMVMWFAAKNGSVMSGFIGIILGILIILQSNFITLFLGIMLIIDSLIYIFKSYKA